MSGDLLGVCVSCGTRLALSSGWVPSYNDPDNSSGAPEAEPFCPKCYADLKAELIIVWPAPNNEDTLQGQADEEWGDKQP
jgi:hypothetical protein